MRTIDALGLPFGQYVLDCVQTALNQLEDMSTAAATSLVAELTAYEAAESTQKTTDLADTESKTLIKADVLEWRVQEGQPSGPQLEMQRARHQIELYLAFSPCLSGYLGNTQAGTQLIRS